MFLILLFVLSNGMAKASDNDGKSTDSEKPVTVLAALGIIKMDENNEYKTDDLITRAQMVEVVTRLLLPDEQVQAIDISHQFQDIEADYWASPYIFFASSLGIINGNEDGNFMPDDSLTYEQAVKILVSILGYDRYAESMGGYPMGYIAVASEKKLTKGISLTIGTETTCGDIAKLVYNSLEVDMYEQNTYSSSGGEYSVVKGCNILNKKLHIYRRSGIVNANKSISLYPGTVSLKQDEVQIGGYTYKTGNTEAAGMIGHYVSFYVREDDVESTILLVMKDDKDKYIELSTDDLVSVKNTRTANAKIEYTDKDTKITDVKVFQYAVYIYNGKPLAEADITDSCVSDACGKIILFDTDDDDRYDLLIISDYKSYVVDAVDAAGNIILTKYDGPQINLEPDGITVDYYIHKGGKPVELKDVTPENVINIEQSKDGTYINIIIGKDAKRNGIIKAVGSKEQDGVYNVTIDSDTYEVATDFTGSIKLNDTGDFYFNLNKQIIAFEISTASINYAYLYKAGVNKSGLFSTGQLQLINLEGKAVVCDIADKVKFNGQESTSENSVAQLQDDAGDTIRQPVIIELNPDGEITVISTKDTNDTDKYQSYIKSSYSTITDNRNYSIIYRPYENTFKGMAAIDKDTIVIGVPGDTDSLEDYFVKKDAEKYFNSLGYNKTYDIETFGMDDVGLVKVVLLYVGGAGGGAIDTERMILIDRVSKVIDKDDCSVYKIYGFYKNASFSQIVQSKESLENDVSKLRKGDVIQANQNGAYITSVRLICSPYADAKAGSLLSTPDILGSIGDNNEVGYGSINAKNASYISIKCNKTKRIFKIPTKDFYKYQASENKVKKAGIGDIIVGTAVVYKAQYDGLQDLILYK